MNQRAITRRAFLAASTTTVLSACNTGVNTAKVVPRKISPNERLNVATVGMGVMGRGNTRRCSMENIVALCDVDYGNVENSFEKYAQAKQFKDYRVMFDTMAKDIDAVVIATPDHTHAVVSMAAIENGKHIYCQKPLAHNLHEVRTVTQAARKAGVQTQMGNQGHSSDTIRLVKEWIEDGAIGKVKEIHAWSDRPVGGSKSSTFPIMARPKDTPPVPKTMDWDLWLGPAPYRPYHPAYHPRSWRGFYDFGTGGLGDMGCHILDPAFWALDLGHPDWVQASSTHLNDEASKECYPRAAVVNYHFPKRAKHGPIKLTWYDGLIKPPIPEGLPGDLTLGGNGALIVGDKGVIKHGSHGAAGAVLLPESRRAQYSDPKPYLDRVPQTDNAHEADWLQACKGGTPASANFEYGGPLTEMVLIGVLAIRMKDQRLDWDGDNLVVTNNEAANALVNPTYRDGWSL